jgi:hypothetical protein
MVRTSETCLGSQGSVVAVRLGQKHPHCQARPAIHRFEKISPSWMAGSYARRRASRFSDEERAALAIKGGEGKRLTYRQTN